MRIADFAMLNANIQIICFAASYTLALVLEISRLFFRSGVRGAVMLGFAGAGLVAHTWFLAIRASSTAAVPLSSWYDWFLVAAWILVIAYLYLVYYHPLNPIGLFVLPLVLGLIGFANLMGDVPFPRSQAAWAVIHGTSLLGGIVVVLIGFVSGLMYLVQAGRLKRKQLPAQGLRLPSLEWSGRINIRSIVVSTLFLGVGVLSGLILNVINSRKGNSDAALPWDDPVVLSTGVLFGWLVAATVFNACYRPAREGRKIAYLTVVTFVFLLMVLAVMWLLPTGHGPKKDSPGASEPAAYALHIAVTTESLSFSPQQRPVRPGGVT